MKRGLVAKWGVGIVLLAAGAYTADDVSLRYGIPAGRKGFSQVTVQPLLAVPLKDKKTSYVRAEPETRTCVESVAPHFGFPPCWYLRKTARRKQDM